MSMMRDIALTNEELSHVIAKSLRQLTEMDQNELPPLVYQLLLLSAKVYVTDGCCIKLFCTDGRSSVSRRQPITYTVVFMAMFPVYWSDFQTSPGKSLGLV